jgi:transcriptional regulator with XRE-family HTH domain
MLIAELREARRAKGWTQARLAERIGVSSQTVKRLEKGIGSTSNLLASMQALEFTLTGVGAGATLTKQLQARRRRQGLSMAEVAMRAKLSRTTVADLERGGGSVASLLRLLDALAPRARRRAPERAYWGQAEKADRDSRFTPSSFLAPIYDAFGPIDLDPCGHELSPVVARRRLIPEQGADGLTDTWTGRLVYLNPPYSQLLLWLRRAHEQWRAGNVETVVGLVPVRTDSSWFHEVFSSDADIFLLKGRVSFLDTKGKKQPTPFSLMIFTLGAGPEQKRRFAALVSGFWLSRHNAPRD